MILFDDKIVQIQTVEFYSRNKLIHYLMVLYYLSPVYIDIIMFLSLYLCFHKNCHLPIQ